MLPLPLVASELGTGFPKKIDSVAIDPFPLLGLVPT